jgi:flavin-binding protein dodecin
MSIVMDSGRLARGLRRLQDRKSNPTGALVSASVAWRARPHRCTLAASNRSPEALMSDHVYKLVDIVGSSATSSDDAIRNAIAAAAKTLRRIDWFEVVETRGHVTDGKVAHFQVTLKVGFRLEQ